MITISKKGSTILFKGHAKFADYGKDIVCASVSSIFITTVNGILSIDPQAIEASESQITIIKNNDVVNKLIDNMLNLLQALALKYPQNIQIRNEE